MTHHEAHRLKTFYRHYIDRCNAHDFCRLADFVAHDVEVNGQPVGLSGYVAGLHTVIEAFPAPPTSSCTGSSGGWSRTRSTGSPTR